RGRYRGADAGGMRRRATGVFLLAAGAVLAAATCQSTRTIVAKIVTPTAAPAPPPPPPSTPAPPSPSPTVAVMPVVTAPPASIYDRSPGVLYEHTAPPTRPAPTTGGSTTVRTPARPAPSVSTPIVVR